MMNKPVFMPSDARIELDLFWGCVADGRRHRCATLMLESDGGSTLRVRSAMVDVDAVPGFAKRLAVTKASTYGCRTCGTLVDNLREALEQVTALIHANLFASDPGTLANIEEPMRVEMRYYSHATDTAPVKVDWRHVYRLETSVERAGSHLKAV